MKRKPAKVHIPFDVTYEQWKELRAPYIGASDVGAILAWFEDWPKEDQPWGSAFRIYHRIVGSLEYDQEEFEIDQYCPAECGREFEDGIARMYEKRYPELEIGGKAPTYQHPEIDYLVATPDYLVAHPERGEGVAQFKLVTSNGRKKWEGGLPRYVEAQVQLEMEVMDRSWGHVFAVVDATTRCFYLERDRKYFERIVEACEHLQDTIKRRDPKSLIDGSDDVTRTLKETEPTQLREGENLLSSECSQNMERYETIMIERRKLDQELNEIKNRIRSEMSDHEKGFIEGPADLGEGWGVSYKSPTSPRLNSKKVKEEHPEIFDACSEPSSRRLIIRRRKP